MSADSDAIYCCVVCTNPRRFGQGFPDDRDAICQLACSFCEKVTPHRFSHVDFEGIPPTRKYRAMRSNAHA